MLASNNRRPHHVGRGRQTCHCAGRAVATAEREQETNNLTSPRFERFADFTLATSYEAIPPSSIARVQDLVLDLIGVGAAATSLDAARLAREISLRLFNAAAPGDRARILFDGRSASLAGAAYAGATQIDSLDAHDGYSLAKGHAGCGLLPGVLAFAERSPGLSGREFLAAMVIGYELASRAGVALHGTVTDYHTSGAWVALAVAALGVRLRGGDAKALRHAIGIAEYHGPRSQMMREIDNPTMLHDGSGWGSMVGVTAAELALAGFEGAPAITIEAEDASPYWEDLGTVWLTEQQNIKLFPVCRWAHAPIQAALDLKTEHGLQVEDIAAVEVHSFHEAVRLATDMPETTAKAQYSISYPVAAALKYGRVGVREVSGATFEDSDIARLVAATTTHECPHCVEHFPADRLGRTVIVTKDGQRLDSGIVRAPGEHTAPIDREGIERKFFGLVEPVMTENDAQALVQATYGLDTATSSLRTLSDRLFVTPTPDHRARHMLSRPGGDEGVLPVTNATSPGA